MTLRELYQKMDGDYDAAMRTMMMESIAGRMIVRLPDDPNYGRLISALETMNETEIFEASHALKGVCGNLGLKKLSDAAAEMCDAFRPGRERTWTDGQVQEHAAEITRLYEQAIAGVREYTGQ